MRTILVVDDDLDTAEMLGFLLAQEGFSLRIATSAQLGLELAREPPAPSLILLDLRMPGMNGLQFLEQQWHDARLATVPTIVTSASSVPEDVAKRVECVLRKPFELQALIGALERVRWPADPIV